MRKHTIRGEYYNDENSVIVASAAAGGFKTLGISLNVDYQLSPNIVWRIEGRRFSSKEVIFADHGDSMTGSITAVTTALAIAF